MKQIIRVEGMTMETAKTGKPYTKFMTSEGSIGVFEDEVVKGLSQAIGEAVEVEIMTRPNGYKNITKVYSKAPMPQLQASKASFAVPSVKDSAVQTIIHEIVDEGLKNWVEVGKAGERFKIYFKDVDDMAVQYKKAKMAIMAINAELNHDLNTSEE